MLNINSSGNSIFYDYLGCLVIEFESCGELLKLLMFVILDKWVQKYVKITRKFRIQKNEL
jgi:hypothetical protein